MKVKFASLMFPKKFSTWVLSSRYFSSISSAVLAQNYPEKSHKNVISNTEIDHRIRNLKNDLCPDSLIRVLDNTLDLNSAIRVFKWASLQKQFKHTPDTYSNIILKLGLSGNVDEMEGFCNELVEFRGGENAFQAVLDVFVSNNRLDEAIRVVLVMNLTRFKLSVDKWNSVLSALVVGKREFRDVLLIYKEMVKSKTLPNVDTLNSLIKALFDADMVDKAYDQFRRMKKKRCMPDCRTFEIVVNGLIMSSRVAESISVMNEMFEDSVNPDLTFCNNIIPLLSKENKLEHAMKLFELMKSLNYTPDFSTHEELIKCLYINLRFTEAIELSENMHKLGFDIPIDILVDVLHACCKLGKLDEGRALLEDNQFLNPSPYNVVLQGYCDANRLLSAKDFLQEMLLMNVTDNLSWNILFQGLCSENFVKQARELLGKMIVLSYSPDCPTYSALITSKCHLNEYEGALNIFQQMKEKDWILDHYSYTELFKGLCNIQKFPEALELFKYMSVRNSNLESSGLSLDVGTYCVLLQSMVALNQIKYCVLFLNQMVLEEDLVPNSETLGIVVQYIACHTKLHLIWDCVQKVCRESTVVDSDRYNLLINGLYKEGCKSEACLLLDYMLEKGWVPDGVTHGLLIGTGDMQTDVGKDGFVVGDEVSSILSEGLGDAEDNTVVT